jgi:hypothetical protein
MLSSSTLGCSQCVDKECFNSAAIRLSYGPDDKRITRKCHLFLRDSNMLVARRRFNKNEFLNFSLLQMRAAITMRTVIGDMHVCTASNFSQRTLDARKGTCA